MRFGLSRLRQSRLSGALASLYSLYIVNNLCPLVLIPYLARMLGPEAWGQYVFADASARVLQTLVEYGFHLSGTREVAANAGRGEARARTVSGVLGVQLILAACAVAALFLFAMWIPPFRNAARLLPGAALWAVCTAMCPLWYFQGVERLPRMVAVDMVTKIAGLAGILWLVRQPADNWKVLTIQGGFALASLGLGYWLVFREVRPVVPGVKAVMDSLRSGRALFLSRASVLLYTVASPVIASFCVGAREVGYFAAADRICRAAVNSLHPMNQAFYPRIVQMNELGRRLAARFACKAGGVMLAYNAISSAVLFFGAEPLVRIVAGEGYAASAGVLRILALVPVANAISNLLGLQWMVALHMDRAYLAVTVCAGLANLALMPRLSGALGLAGLAWAVVTAEVAAAAAVCGTLALLGADPVREAFRSPGSSPAMDGSQPC
ncbi:MAG: oligosaccharide flippase family protein [Bryobacteraceae bacterium]